MRAPQCSLAALMLCLATVVAPAVAAAQTPASPRVTNVPAALEQFRTTWREAWIRRDVDALAALATEDLDWIAADGTWLKGRRAFRDHHARIFAVQFRDAQWTTLDERLVVLDSLTAIEIRATHVSGDTFADSTARAPRRSVGTRVYVRRNGRWFLQTSHNTIIAPLTR